VVDRLALVEGNLHRAHAICIGKRYGMDFHVLSLFRTTGYVSYDINKFLNITNFYFENAFLLHRFHCCTRFVWNGLFVAIFHFNAVLAQNDSSSSWKMLWWPQSEALAGISSVFTEIFILIFLRSNHKDFVMPVKH